MRARAARFVWLRAVGFAHLADSSLVILLLDVLPHACLRLLRIACCWFTRFYITVNAPRGFFTSGSPVLPFLSLCLIITVLVSFLAAGSFIHNR